ncbi:hypothetical protein GCM10010176_075320 [Nonomuraea spiralis]|nr:hypothetical protein GCM10010176_075320 [Nonomuraea spiralis]
MADPRHEQGQQLRLLSRAGVQFDATAPQPQRTQDLQAQRIGAGRRIFTAEPNGMS